MQPIKVSAGEHRQKKWVTQECHFETSLNLNSSHHHGFYHAFNQPIPRLQACSLAGTSREDHHSQAVQGLRVSDP